MPLYTTRDVQGKSSSSLHSWLRTVPLHPSTARRTSPKQYVPSSLSMRFLTTPPRPHQPQQPEAFLSPTHLHPYPAQALPALVSRLPLSALPTLYPLLLSTHSSLSHSLSLLQSSLLNLHGWEIRTHDSAAHVVGLLDQFVVLTPAVSYQVEEAREVAERGMELARRLGEIMGGKGSGGPRWWGSLRRGRGRWGGWGG